MNFKYLLLEDSEIACKAFARLLTFEPLCKSIEITVVEVTIDLINPKKSRLITVTSKKTFFYRQLFMSIDNIYAADYCRLCRQRQNRYFSLLHHVSNEATRS